MKHLNARMHRPLRLLGAAAFLIFIFAACQTTPTEIPEDLSAPKLFQLAQDEVDNDNFEAALAYYEAALERFEDDPEVATTARYEIGFIHYREGRLDEARPYFERVLATYENGQQNISEWPRVLAGRFLDEMGEPVDEDLVPELDEEPEEVDPDMDPAPEDDPLPGDEPPTDDPGFPGPGPGGPGEPGPGFPADPAF